MFEAALITNQDLFLKTYDMAVKNPLADFLMVFGADYLIFITFIFALFLALTKGVNEKKAFLLILFSFGIAFILIKTLGALINEPRPFITYQLSPLISFAPNDAFPSDHTIMMTVIFLAFAYYRSKFAPVFFLCLCWVGFARVYAGVHYPLDIIGGIVFAIVAVLISVQIKKKVRTYFYN